MATPTAQEMLDKYLVAEQALLEGKSIQWNGRTLTRENLDVIQRGRREWESRVSGRSASNVGLASFS